MSSKDPSENQKGNNNNQLILPQIKAHVKSVQKRQKSAKERQQLKLPLIHQRNNQKIDQSSPNNVQQKKGVRVKSPFADSIKNKIHNILNAFSEKAPDQGYGSGDSDEFDLQFKVKKNRQIIKRDLLIPQKNVKIINQCKNASKQKPRLLLPLQNPPMIEGRPKSSRDMSNDNNLIQFRNQAISYKRPKSSKNIKNLNQNQFKSVQKQQNDNGQPKGGVHSPKANRKSRQQIQTQSAKKTCQKDVRLMDKQVFANQIRLDMKNVLDCINRFRPQEQVDLNLNKNDQFVSIKQKQQLKSKDVIQQSSQNFAHIKKQENVTIQKDESGEENKKQSPCFSQKSLKNEKQKQAKKGELIYRRPKSSKYAKSATSKQKQPGTNLNQYQQMKHEQNQKFQSIKKRQIQTQQKHRQLTDQKQKVQKCTLPQQGTQKKQKPEANAGQLKKKLSPKIPKLPKKLPSPAVQSKKQIVFNIKRPNRALSQKKILQGQRNYDSVVITRNQSNNGLANSKQKSRQRQRQSSKKSIKDMKEQKDNVNDIVNGKNKKLLVDNNFTTQQLRKAKMELDKKIRQIDKQMKQLYNTRQLELQSKEIRNNNEARMRISGRDWKKLNLNGQGEKICNQDQHQHQFGDGFLDNELQRIQKLQNRGECMFEEYLQNRMMLMDLNIHNKQEEIMDEVYLGDNQKVNPT